MIVSEPTEAMLNIIDYDNLYNSLMKSKHIGHWKYTYQKIILDSLFNIIELHESILNGTYHLKIKEAFILHERGKVRYIRSLELHHMSVQKSLCDNVIIPRIRKTLIYDNGASLKGKGIGFSKERFEKHLRELHKLSNYNSNNCFVLFGDFTKFFDNIDHEILAEQLHKLIPEEDVFQNIILDWLNASQTDVSYMSDEEFYNATYVSFNSLEHEKRIRSIPKSKRPKGKKILHKGLGIGAQLSQVAGILYLSEFDHYCKEVLKCKLYGRYMDDFYIMSNDKQYLLDLKDKLIAKASELKLQLHPKKFRLCKVSSGITYLKTRYRFYGKKLLKFINPKIIRKQSKKIRKFKEMYDKGIMPFHDILNQIQSWLGTYSDRIYANRQAIYKIRMQFKNTFGIDPIKDNGYKRHSKKNRFKKIHKRRKEIYSNLR